MNIAILSPSKDPYSETFIQAHKNLLKGKVYYYYGQKGGVSLESEKRLGPPLKKVLYKLYRIIFKKPYSYINDKQVIDSFNKNKIEVVLVEYGAHAFNLLGVLKEAKIPFVVHFHGYDASVHQTIKKCNNYKEVFKYASKIVSVSTVMSSMLIDLGCPKQKLVYNVCGPNSEFDNLRANYNKKQFIAVGRFTDKKAPYYLILAFKEVVQKHLNAQLLIAGNGVLFNTCKNLINYYGLNNNIKLLGVIKPEEFRGLLKESLAYVQHSITAENGDMEGTPVSILEASAAGLAVVSTYHSGIQDVIINGETGLLVEEHDVFGMANAMINLLDDIDLAKRLGKNGKQNIISNFSMKRHIEQLNSILLDSIN
jgi:glycosyltransferase involved in cell wall biosynthesis